MSACRFEIVLLAAVLAGPWLGSPARGQRFRIAQVVEFSEEVQLPEADNVARSHLETIDRFLDAGQWDEAVEALRRLMDVAGERLVPIADNDADSSHFVRYVPLRVYCQMRLAAMYGVADEALTLYRSRVDALAETWLREARDAGDPEGLRRVVDRFFVSSVGDRALYHLGELELARGNFGLAREAWQQTSPALRSAAVWLAYPDTRLNLADVRARLILVSILEGSPERAAAELEDFTRLHGEESGTLAGRQGPYRELLGELLQQSRQWSAASPPEDWPTFGGAATRGRVAIGDVDVAMRPVWTVPLPQREAEQQWIGGVTPPGEDREGLLSYHPLVVGDRVLLATGQRIEDVQAFDLRSGRPLWPAPPPEPAVEPVDAGPLALPLPAGRTGLYEHLGVPRFTMTAEQDRLYVKLGHQATSAVLSERFDPPAPGHLAALDLQAERSRLFEIHLDPQQAAAGWSFEGAPLIDGENLYVGMRRRENLRNQFHVACYTMRRNRAELRWRSFLISSESPGQGELEEYTHNLLTLHEGLIYTNTNLGAVATLGASDGRIRWLTRYPRAPLTDGEPVRNGRYLLRDLNPCLVHNGMAIVAPSDADRIFALDAATGRLVWDAGSGRAEDAVHLLGVGGGHLLASGDRLYWIDVRTGRLRARFPERIEDAMRGYGRGLLVGSQVFWPTRDRIYVLAQDGPRAVRQPIELSPLGMTGGNLVLAGDTLLVAGANRLAAYTPWGSQLNLE